MSGEQVAPRLGAVEGERLDFDDVVARYERMMDWLAGVYVNAMNVIHYMHDKYAYERIEMALHDYAPLRTMAFGMAGLSVVADSLSAIKYARVKVVRDETGLVTDYVTEGEFPFFGNHDNRVDQLAACGREHVHGQAAEVSDLPQRAPHAVDPDDHVERGLRQGDRQHAGRATERASRSRRARTRCTAATATASTRRRRRWRRSRTAMRRTASRSPRRSCPRDSAASPRTASRTSTGMLDAFFGVTGFHMNVNVLNRETLVDAMDHPENYPNLTIRVSGYAVELRAPHARAADGRHQPHVPRRRLCVATTPGAGAPPPLAAKSPFELRGRPRQGRPGDRRSDRPRHRRHGLPALLHHRLGRGRSGRAGRRVDGRVHVALPLLPQPGHVDDDERHPGDARAGDRGARASTARA